MARDYLAEKAAKKKTGQKALWLLMILLVIVVSMVIKIVLTGSLKPDVFSGLPSSDEAYTVAKQFIRPTLKTTSTNFSDSHYQFAKTSDSVYVIQSEVNYKDDKNEATSTKFKIILKYNGGQANQQKNWEMLNLSVY